MSHGRFEHKDAVTPHPLRPTYISLPLATSIAMPYVMVQARAHESAGAANTLAGPTRPGSGS
jgi:hypothetical protein